MDWERGGAAGISEGCNTKAAAEASVGTPSSARDGKTYACGGTCGEERVTTSSGSSPPVLVAGAPAEAAPGAVLLLAPRGEPVCFGEEAGVASAAPRPTSMLHSKNSMACLPPPPPSLATAAPGICGFRPSPSPTGPLLPPSPLLPAGPLPLLVSPQLPSTLRLWWPAPSASVPATRCTPSPSPASPSMADPNVTVVADPPVACAPPPDRLARIGKGVVGGRGCGDANGRQRAMCSCGCHNHKRAPS